jgi:transposase
VRWVYQRWPGSENQLYHYRCAHSSRNAGCCVLEGEACVKNSDTAGEKGYDAGKKVSGIKRHIAVDTNGLPHGIVVTTADVTDRNGALALFSVHQDNLSNVLNILADGGYSGDKFAEATHEILGCTVEIARRNELHTFAVIPKRWVVERSFTDTLFLIFKESVAPALRLWCMARKMSKALEKLRTTRQGHVVKTQYIIADDRPRFCRIIAKKILNRF